MVVRNADTKDLKEKRDQTYKHAPEIISIKTTPETQERLSFMAVLLLIGGALILAFIVLLLTTLNS